MTRIVLVRHGRTAWNKGEIFRGTSDVPLDDQGRKEADCAGEWLRSDVFHAAYCSPLSRTVETADRILALRGIRATPHLGLIDMNYGMWQGKSREDVRREYPDIYSQWEASPHTVVFPGGEGLSAVRERSLGAVGEIVSRHPGQTVLVVAHRVVNKVLIAAFLGLDDSHFWEIGQDTTALNEFVYKNGKWICRLVNDTCHLRGLDCRTTFDF